MKILVIEDEADLLANMVSYLSTEAEFECETATSTQEADRRLAHQQYEMVVLDLMLPDGDGLDLLRRLKEDQPEAGVLIISAKNALDDRLRGLDLGADDYLTKPFHLAELNARLRAIQRRRRRQGQHTVQFEEITLNTETFEAIVNGEPVTLTVKEYELLLFFITNHNRVLTKQAIAEHLWGDNVDFLNTFDFVYQHIKNLRKKLTAAGSPNYIQTIYGLGYKFGKA